ncbi:MAG: hypothetical protein EOP49_07705 [Sphingobacteriales bacterium]|nr:MAG: hypothetical protein EOP49_07705 [Sphingobacteriales bacterium]
MTAGAGASKSQYVHENMPSIEQCRTLFKAKEYDYSDEELLTQAMAQKKAIFIFVRCDPDQ